MINSYISIWDFIHNKWSYIKCWWVGGFKWKYIFLKVDKQDLAPFYFSDLIFNHFPLWPGGQTCLSDFILPGMLFSWTAAQLPPSLLSSLHSNASSISNAPSTTPHVLLHGIDHHLTDYTFALPASAYLTLCVVTKMIHKCHSRYWDTMWNKAGHKYSDTLPIERWSCVLSLNLDRLCDYSEQQKTAKVTLPMTGPRP